MRQMLLGIQTGFSGDIVTGLAYLDEAVHAFETGGYQPRRPPPRPRPEDPA